MRRWHWLVDGRADWTAARWRCRPGWSRARSTHGCRDRQRPRCWRRSPTRRCRWSARWADVSRVDYTLVRQLRTTTAERLRAERRRRAESSGVVLSLDDERELGRSLIASAVEEHRRDELVRGGGVLPPEEDDATLAAAVEAALFGLGRLEPLMRDEAIANS